MDRGISLSLSLSLPPSPIIVIVHRSASPVFITSFCSCILCADSGPNWSSPSLVAVLVEKSTKDGHLIMKRTDPYLSWPGTFYTVRRCVRLFTIPRLSNEPVSLLSMFLLTISLTSESNETQLPSVLLFPPLTKKKKTLNSLRIPAANC